MTNANSQVFQRRDFLRKTSVASIGLLGACSSWSTSTLLASDDPAANKPEGWELGCFTRPFAEFSYAETLDGIAAAGFSSVGLMAVKLSSGNVTLADATESQVNEIREEAARRKLSLAVTYYSGPPVEQSLEAGIQATRALIDNCHRAGCGSIVLGGTTNETLFDAYYEAVRAACDYAAQKQVSLVLKPHGGLNATGPQCAKIVKQVDHASFRMWYDPGNIYYYSDGQLDPLDDVASVAGIVTGMCVKDFTPPKEVALNPGTGKVQFPELMKRLAAGGFKSGPLIVETLAKGDLTQTIANATQARLFLQNLLIAKEATEANL